MRARTSYAHGVLTQAASEYQVHTEVWSEDPDGVFQCLNDLDGKNWFAGLEWSYGIEQPVAEVRVELWREDQDESISPLMGGSPRNRNGLGQYKRFLNAGRAFYVREAITAVGGVPAAGDWIEVVRGQIDRVSWPGRKSRLVLTGRDLGCVLQDAKTKEEREYGEDGQTVEAGIQLVLDAWAVGVTLYVPVSPGTTIPKVKISKDAPLLQSIRDVAQRIGWDIRYLWDAGTETWRLTLHLPPRDKTVADFTVTPSLYKDVQELAVDRQNVRNSFSITFTNAATGERETRTRTNQDSIDEYDERWMGLEEASDSPIDSPTEADALLEYADSDISEPLLDQEVEILAFPHVELHDVLEFAANNIHYDSAQTLAVVGVRHRRFPKERRTWVQTRGKPVGMIKGWFRKQAASAAGDPELTGTFDLVIDPVTGEVFLTANTTSPKVGSWRARITVGSVQVDAFVAPTFVEGTPGEFSGGVDTWGTRIPTGLTVAPGEAAFLVGFLLAGTGTTAAVQAGVARSRPYQIWRPKDSASPDSNPTLDRDGLKLLLYPGRNILAQSVKWIARTDRAPTETEILAGAVSTGESIETYTWDPAGGEITVYVGQIPFSNADGTGTPGPARVRQRTFATLNEAPSLTATPATSSAANKEAVQLVATDDSDQIAILVRTYAMGSVAPAFTRIPASGFAPDPLLHLVEVVAPQAGEPDILLEAYAEDADSNQSQRMLLRIDAGAWPSGTLELQVEEATGKVYVLPNTSDADSGSWRARVVKGPSLAYVDPQHVDATSAAAWEGGRDTFGARVDTGLVLAPGDKAALSGYIYRTTSPAAATQQLSRKSGNLRHAAGRTGSLTSGNGKVLLDLVNGRLEVQDEQAPPVTRVEVGRTGVGVEAYGIIIRKSDGTVLIDLSGLGINVVGSAQIKDLSVQTAKIEDLAVTNAKIANLSVTNAKIQNLAVTNAKIANLAVDEAKIGNAAITNAKIGNLAVDEAKIADLAVTTAKIQDLAVDNAKIGNLSVNEAKIANASISRAKIKNLAVDDAKIANLDAAKITAGTLKDALTGNQVQFDLDAALLTIRDQQADPAGGRSRVRLGRLGLGVADYGIEIFDQTGKLILGASGLGTNIVGRDQLTDGEVVAAKLTADSQAFVATVDFSAADWNTVSWTAGVLTLADGTIVNILAGGTGNITDDLYRYVYFDGTTTLKSSVNASDATGAGRILLCVAQRASNTSGQAFYVPRIGMPAVPVAAASVGDAALDTGSNLARALRSQNGRTMHGGGDMTWTGDALTWTERLISIPDPNASNGWFGFGPLAGVVLPEWGAVVFRMLIGTAGDRPYAVQSTGAPDSQGWFVADYTSYVPPDPSSGYVDYLIAVHNGDTNLLYLWDGRVIPPGKTIRGGFSVPDATIGTAHIVDASITNAKIDTLHGDKIVGNTITGVKINAATLAAIKADLGDIAAGRIRNPANTAGINFGGSYGSPDPNWQNYINMMATGEQPWLKHGALELNANGTGSLGDLFLVMSWI